MPLYRIIAALCYLILAVYVLVDEEKVCNDDDESRRTVDSSSSASCRRRRLHRASRGLTEALLDDKTVSMILSACQQQQQQHDTLLPVLGGALWFRFHCRADTTAMVHPHFLVKLLHQDEEHTLETVLEWALGSSLSLVLNGLALLFQSSCPKIPTRIVDLLLESCLQEEGERQQTAALRLRPQLVLLNLLKVHDHVCSLARTLPLRVCADKPRLLQPFVTACISNAPTMDNLSARWMSTYLVPFCLENGGYHLAWNVLQSSDCIKIRWKDHEESNAVDLFHYQVSSVKAAMQQHLMEAPNDAERSALSCMAQCLLDIEDDDKIDVFQRACGLHRLFNTLLHLDGQTTTTELATKCLERAHQLFQIALDDSYRHVSARFYYAGMIYWIKGWKSEAKPFLQARTELQNTMKLATLANVLCEFDPDNLVVGQSDDVGISFATKELLKEIDRVEQICWRLLQTSSPCTDEELQEMDQLVRIHRTSRRILRQTNPRTLER